jgi:tRNA (cytidine/uridine-2'-O-)-methyltransferase
MATIIVFHLIIYQPEIPPNTGNIIRLCANVGAELHLIHPLGFSMDSRQLKRAGLDYHELATVHEHDSLADCLDSIRPQSLYAISTRGGRSLYQVELAAGDAFLLGPETRGLPQELLDEMPAERVVRIPMRPGNRSLNLSNAAAVVVYEAWRQAAFAGAD